MAHPAFAILNKLARALFRQLDFDFVPAARRFLDPNFHIAWHLVC